MCGQFAENAGNMSFDCSKYPGTKGLKFSTDTLFQFIEIHNLFIFIQTQCALNISNFVINKPERTNSEKLGSLGSSPPSLHLSQSWEVKDQVVFLARLAACFLIQKGSSGNTRFFPRHRKSVSNESFFY